MINGRVFFGKASQKWRGVIEYQGLKKTEIFTSKEQAEQWVIKQGGILG